MKKLLGSFSAATLHLEAARTWARAGGLSPLRIRHLGPQVLWTGG